MQDGMVAQWIVLPPHVSKISDSILSSCLWVSFGLLSFLPPPKNIPIGPFPMLNCPRVYWCPIPSRGPRYSCLTPSVPEAPDPPQCWPGYSGDSRWMDGSKRHKISCTQPWNSCLCKIFSLMLEQDRINTSLRNWTEIEVLEMVICSPACQVRLDWYIQY